MRITNKYNLPEALVRVCENDSYSKGGAHYSVTGLLKPPRIVRLEEKHREDLVTDVSDMIYLLEGKSVHGILEAAAKVDKGLKLIEERLYTEQDGYKISGQVDSFAIKEGILQDWKRVSVWSILKESHDNEWTQQLNVYAWMLRKHGYQVEALQVVAFIRDWKKREAQENLDYPPKQVHVITLPLWGDERVELFVRERLALHEVSKSELPDCTPTERWEKSTMYAVMKGGRKRAIGKLHNTLQEAVSWIERNAKAGESLYTEERPGFATRCESYCTVGKLGFCEQWNKDPLNRERDSLAKELDNA